jgi:dephospho-CoA kinase
MGKSTAAAMLRARGWPVFDADSAVHQLTGPGGVALAAISRAFPGVVGAGGVDRPALAAAVFGDAPALRTLEGILHPLVAAARRRFLLAAAFAHRRVVVLDVPLLFETGGHRMTDATVVVTAPAFLQRQRALARRGMTAERLKAVLARQLADHAKRHQAFLVVPTGLGKRESLRRLHALRHVRRTAGSGE